MKNKFKWIISVFFLITAFFLSIMHQIKGGGPNGSPSVDSLCPFGGLETLFSLIKDGSYIKKISPSSIILLIAIILLTFIIGRAFCGYICPLGTIQTLINKIGKKLKIKQIKLPKKLDKTFRYAKFIVLFIVLFTTYKAEELIFRPYDPWATFMHLSTGSEIFKEFLVGFILLITILIISLFIERAWCRYFCPLGGALSLISIFRIFKIKKNNTLCVNCKICSKNCPMGLEIHSKENISNIECISCGECLTLCPKKETLKMKNKKISLSINKIGLIIITTLTLVIGLSILTGNFKTSLSNKETLTQNQMLNPDNIRGYMTINEICTEFNIKPYILLEKCNLPKDTNINKPIKELKNELKQKEIDFETSDLKEVLKSFIK